MYYYVYTLQSENDPDRFYTGFTDNLESRLKAHNQGKSKHTLKYITWKVKTAVAFIHKERALAFEKYLKKTSERVFAKKRL